MHALVTVEKRKRSGLTDVGCSVDVAAVASEKAVYKAGRVLIVVHRAKIDMCVYTAWNCTAVADSTQVQMGSLDLHLNTARQRVPHIKVGILDIRCAMDDSIVGALAEWIVCDSVALIKGWFGKWQQRRVGEARL